MALGIYLIFGYLDPLGYPTWTEALKLAVGCRLIPYPLFRASSVSMRLYGYRSPKMVSPREGYVMSTSLPSATKAIIFVAYIEFLDWALLLK